MLLNFRKLLCSFVLIASSASLTANVSVVETKTLFPHQKEVIVSSDEAAKLIDEMIQEEGVGVRLIEEALSEINWSKYGDRPGKEEVHSAIVQSKVSPGVLIQKFYDPSGDMYIHFRSENADDGMENKAVRLRSDRSKGYMASKVLVQKFQLDEEHEQQAEMLSKVSSNAKHAGIHTFSDILSITVVKDEAGQDWLQVIRNIR